MTNLLIVSLAIALDFVWGEWRRFQPMTVFRSGSRWVESWLNPSSGDNSTEQGVVIRRICGGVSATLMILPVVSLVWALSQIPGVGFAVSVMALFWATGARAVSGQAMSVLKPMIAGDMNAARDAAAFLSNRKAADVSEDNVARVTVESVLEKGNDEVFGSLFWFFVAGAPGVVLYRLTRVLSTEWAYSDKRCRHFGWSVGWLSEILGWIPSRLTACTYAALGNVRLAWRCWRQQATVCQRTGMGPVMAAGAGSLGVKLGGPGLLDGETVDRPWLGAGRAPQAADIRGAIFLVQQGLALWLVLYCVVEAVIYAAF